MAIPTAASQLPRRAVAGDPNILIPTMNRAAAAKLLSRAIVVHHSAGKTPDTSPSIIPYVLALWSQDASKFQPFIEPSVE
jgi:hypothetical protein